MLDIKHSVEEKAFVNNLEICYDTFGNKEDPAVLLIAGLGNQLIHWTEKFCVPLASNGYYVIRFDNRDTGLSTKLDNLGVPDISKLIQDKREGKPIQVPYTGYDMLKDTVGLLDYLEIDSAHVIGHSMGGGIAQGLAIEYPDRVKSLTSIASSTSNPNLPPAKPEALEALNAPPSPVREKNIDQSVYTFRVLSGPFRSIDEDFIRKLSGRAFDRSFYPDGLVRKNAMIISSGSRNEQLKKLKIKALVIHGDADPLISVQAAEDTANSIPESKLLIIKGMGHEMADEDISQIIPAIVEFFKGI